MLKLHTRETFQHICQVQKATYCTAFVHGQQLLLGRYQATNQIYNQYLPLSPQHRNRFISQSPLHLSNNTQHQTRSVMKIYTKTGDKGESSLYNGTRRPKSDLVFETLGAADELNASLGLAREHCAQLTQKLNNQQETQRAENLNSLEYQLKEIQSRLIDLGSTIATPLQDTSPEKIAKVKFDENQVQYLEQWIDEYDEQLPELTKFILPSGGMTSSQLHVARTHCRNAERLVVRLANEQQQEGLDEVQKYLNRLSDYLFTAARYACKIEGKEEVPYQKQV